MNTESVKQPHSIFLTDRKKAEITGILEVESFQDSCIILSSSLGELSIEGEELKIDSFSVDSGKIIVTGSISGLFYYENTKPHSGLFGRRGK